MVTTSFSIDIETYKKIEDFALSENISNTSQAISTLVKRGIIYTKILDEQDMEVQLRNASDKRIEAKLNAL